MNGLKSTIDQDKTPELKEKPSIAAKGLPPGSGDYRLQALARLLSCEHFRASERNKRFLKFVVEETVSGRAGRIKAFTVAVDVFGRDSNFDASVDPIVRIAAGHLRRALDDYYATHGRNDPVRISLPLGTYVPTFTLREKFPRRMAKRLQLLVADRRRRLQSGAVGVAMALSAAGAAMFYVTVSPSEGSLPQKPIIVVDHARAGNAAAGLADLFTQSLWIALGRQEAVRTVGVRADEDIGMVLARARKSFSAGAPLLQLLTTVNVDNGELHVYWHVLDGRSNETYLSASGVTELVPGDPDAAYVMAARAVADSLAHVDTAPNSKRGASPGSLFGVLPWRWTGGE